MFDYEDDELKEKVNPNRHVCPVCGKQELAYVPEYHKCVGTRIAIGLFKLLAWGCFILTIIRTLNGITIGEAMEIDTEFLPGIFIFLSAALILKGFVFDEESRTHIQGICKNCGHIWFIT